MKSDSENAAKHIQFAIHNVDALIKFGEYIQYVLSLKFTMNTINKHVSKAAEYLNHDMFKELTQECVNLPESIQNNTVEENAQNIKRKMLLILEKLKQEKNTTNQ